MTVDILWPQVDGKRQSNGLRDQQMAARGARKFFVQIASCIMDEGHQTAVSKATRGIDGSSNLNDRYHINNGKCSVKFH